MTRKRVTISSGMAHAWMVVPLALFPDALDFGKDRLRSRYDPEAKILYLWYSTDGRRFMAAHQDDALAVEEGVVEPHLIQVLPLVPGANAPGDA